MSDDLRAQSPDYHTRQATQLRALAENVTTARIKDRLLNEAEQHERLAAAVGKVSSAGEVETRVDGAALGPVGFGLGVRASMMHKKS